VMSPHRISRESNTMQRLINGVFTDADGMAIGYRAKRKDPMMGEVTYNVAARDRYGRPIVVHVFDGLPETQRGISPLVSVLKVMRQYDQLADATLTSAIVQNVFAATIESEAPTEEVLDGLLTPQERAMMAKEGISPAEAFIDAHAGYYDGSTIDVGVTGRIAHLYPGDKFDLKAPKIQAANFREFATFLMREFSRAAGMDYSSATGDFSGATYYTLGKSNTEIFAVTKMRREFLLTPFCQPVYEAWLEEQIEAGRIPFPGGIDAYLVNRAAASRAVWSGSPKPEADILKLAKGMEVFDRMGVITDQMIADTLGVTDIEDVYEGRAREGRLRKRYGLPEKTLMPAAGGKPEVTEEEEEPEGNGNGA
jgi:capsid protein